MKTYCVDFESYYDKDFDIASVGTYHYLRSEQTDIYLLSVVEENYEFVGPPEKFDWTMLHGHRVIAHNYAFDGDCINALRERGIIPADLIFGDMCCTADMMVCLGYPRSLKKAVKACFDEEMSKEVRDKMKGKHVKDLGEEDRKALYEYASEDSRWAYKLWVEYSQYWTETERAISKLNRETGWRGCVIDRDALEKQKVILNGLMFDLEKLIPWSGEDVPLLSPKKLRSYCNEQGIDLPKSVAEKNPEFIEWLKDYEPKVQVIKHLREWRKANILLQKLKVLESRIRPDGTFATELKYIGAVQTGRFSGMSKFNLQNLPRESWNGVDIRRLFKPRAGHKFILADLAQIEARVLNWLAGNEKMLVALRDGWNIYEAFARASKMWNGDKGTLKKKDVVLYNAAKAQCLGAGYGLGHNKFVNVAPILTSGAYNPTYEEAVAAIKNFRKSNPAIVKYWGKLEAQFMGFIASSPNADFGFELPSGRLMNYWSLGYEGNIQYRKEPHPDAPFLKAWGGKLAENVTQATARDILTHHMLELTKFGTPFVFTVHDEIVCEVPSETAEASEKEIQKIMSTAPSWCHDLPLGVETKITEHYEK